MKPFDAPTPELIAQSKARKEARQAYRCAQFAVHKQGGYVQRSYTPSRAFILGAVGALSPRNGGNGTYWVLEWAVRLLELIVPPNVREYRSSIESFKLICACVKKDPAVRAPMFEAAWRLGGVKALELIKELDS